MSTRGAAGVAMVLGLVFVVIMPVDGIASAQAVIDPATIQVDLRGNTLYGEYWPGTEVSISVTRQGSQVFMTLLPVLDDEGTINAGLDFDVQPWDVVRAVADDGTSRELVLTPIEVTSIDAAEDTISGVCTSALSATVTVWAWPPNVFVDTPCIEDRFFLDATGFFDIDPTDPDQCGWVGQSEADGDAVTWGWDPPRGFGFEGFFPPIDNGAVNLAKAGQVVPVRWRVLDAVGSPVDDPSSFVGLTSDVVGCETDVPVDAVETYAANAASLRYLDDGVWGLNWRTPSMRGCHTLTLTLSDGSEHEARFRVR